MIAASIATHFTARLSVQRQAAMGTPAHPQTAMMNKLTMYIFPLGVLVFGGGFPVGLLLYWLSNNGWTLAQQHFVFQRMDREDDEGEGEGDRAAQRAGPEARPEAGAQPKPSRPRPSRTRCRHRRGCRAGRGRQAAAEQATAGPETARPEAAVKPIGAEPGRDEQRAPRKQTGQEVENAPAKNAPGRRQHRRQEQRQCRPTNGAKQDRTAAVGVDGRPRRCGRPRDPGLISDRPRRRKQARKRG